MLRLFLFPLSLLLLAAPNLAAQEITLQLQPGSEISFEGTSNVRDWGADVKQINAEFSLVGVEEINLETMSPENFGTLRLIMPVKEMDSGTRGLTKNIHKYLKEKEYPEVTFTLTEIQNVTWNGDYAEITAKGVINAAGTDNNVDMLVRAEEVNGVLQFSGTQDLKLTGFEIDPPTAMLGTVRARDEFSVHYKVAFTQ